MKEESFDSPPSWHELPYLDVHNHISGKSGFRNFRNYEGAAESALGAMERLNIEKMFVMPPPFPPQFRGGYEIDEIMGVLKKISGRFEFLGGGGTLNVMIQQHLQEKDVDSKTEKLFEKQALGLLSKGVIGFGELTSEHFSLSFNHPYVSAPPDHPLFLLLSNIAADRGVPVDIHMEAVPEEMPLPEGLKSPPNPEVLRPNIGAFERLLKHNRKAKIIWAHVGWDCTGKRTAALCGQLLEKHPNLYMSIKFGRVGSPETQLMEKGRGIKTGWLDLIKRFPDRFLIGSDQFYFSPKIGPAPPRNAEISNVFLSSLPKDLAKKIGHENAVRVFKM